MQCTDSSSDNDESKAVLTTPQAGWDKDTGQVGGLKSPPTRTEIIKGWGGGRMGGGVRSGNGEGLSWGPGGRTSVTSATLN